MVGTYCGIFRRQALDKGALLLGANKICTGHNADDIAETVLMNSKLQLLGLNMCFGLLRVLYAFYGILCAELKQKQFSHFPFFAYSSTR